MTHAQLLCSRCGAGFRDADLDERKRTATCRFCGALTTLPTDVPAETPPSQAAIPDAATSQAGSVRPKVPCPDSITRFETAEGIRLTYRWFSPILFFLLFFCAVWDGFLIFWYSMGIARGGPAGGFAWIFFLFPICHVAVGIGLTYFVIAGFLNRTWIDVTRSDLRVQHGPVPWKGNKTLEAANIDQLYCTQAMQGSSGTRLYSVSVLFKDQRKATLVSLLHNADEARYIERTVEEFLGLEHHPVAGELA